MRSPSRNRRGLPLPPGSARVEASPRSVSVHAAPPSPLNLLQPMELLDVQPRLGSYAPITPHIHGRESGTVRLPGVNELLQNGQSSRQQAPHAPGWYNPASGAPQGQLIPRHPLNTSMDPPQQMQFSSNPDLAPSSFPGPSMVSRDDRHVMPVPRPAPQAFHTDLSGAIAPFPGGSTRGQIHRAQSQFQPDAHLSSSASPPGYLNILAHERRRDSARPGSGPTLNGAECVGQRTIPGKGLCYVYDDGRTIPTSIDGENVQPQYGITKLGKARKRLAQACMNCREKKIKCEPRIQMRCVQCEKTKRDCYMSSAPYSQAETSTTRRHVSAMLEQSLAPGDPCSYTSTTPKLASPTHSHKRTRSTEMSCTGSADSSTTEVGASFAKRVKTIDTGSISPSITAAEDSTYLLHRTPHHNDDRYSIISPMAFPENFRHDDPYKTDPEQTLHLLDQCFAQFSAVHQLMFPRHTFMRWVRHGTDKSHDERTLLCSVLALGSAFTPGSSPFARHCAENATRAIANSLGNFNLAIIQSRLLMAMYHFAKGKRDLAWEFTGTALRAMSAERMNTEEGCSTSDGDGGNKTDSLCFLTPNQLVECKRRTFWSGYLIDSFHGFCGGMLFLTKPDTIYLRLPCSNEAYEDGSRPSNTPFFSSSIIDPSLTVFTASSAVRPTAYMIQLCRYWVEAVEFTHIGGRRAASAYATHYEAFYEETTRKLAEWRSRLPSHLHYSRSNLQSGLAHDCAGHLLSMHMIYHLTHLEAARFTRHELLSPQSVDRNIRTAHAHANQILCMTMDFYSQQLDLPEGRTTSSYFSPFAGYAIAIAIDTVSAGGFSKDLPAIMATILSGRDMLQELASNWAFAHNQLKIVERRINKIGAKVSGLRDSRSGTKVDVDESWSFDVAMEEHWPLHSDVVYGAARATYFEALRRE